MLFGNRPLKSSQGAGKHNTAELAVLLRIYFEICSGLEPIPIILFEAKSQNFASPGLRSRSCFGGVGKETSFTHSKKVKGRKRHILVDTMGLLWSAVVHPGNIQDRDGALLVFQKTKNWFTKLKLVWADGGYAGQLIDAVRETYGWTLEVIKRSDDLKGFHILPKRWIVERAFSWFNRYRRLSKDYEFDTKTSEAMLYLVMIHIMVRRLA